MAASFTVSSKSTFSLMGTSKAFLLWVLSSLPRQSLSAEPVARAPSSVWRWLWQSPRLFRPLWPYGFVFGIDYGSKSPATIGNYPNTHAVGFGVDDVLHLVFAGNDELIQVPADADIGIGSPFGFGGVQGGIGQAFFYGYIKAGFQQGFGLTVREKAGRLGSRIPAVPMPIS